MQVDSLATNRDSDMNEATRRLLGVLLRFIDGFKATNSIVVAATNRKQDLDAALLSRCDAIVNFGLPDAACRAAILEHYAAHLKDKVLWSSLVDLYIDHPTHQWKHALLRPSHRSPMAHAAHAAHFQSGGDDMRGCKI
jgi:SpoVK/Ycf46/Vps4 family AAA+-type ATPase